MCKKVFPRINKSLKWLVVFLFILASLPIISAQASANIYRVKPSGITSGDCGASWSKPCSLQYALSLTVSGDEIWVSTGTYKPTTSAYRTKSFTLKSGVAVFGGFLGTETLRDQRDPIKNPTVLSGDIGTVGAYGDNSFHVVIGSDGAILDGFTITSGNANGTSPNNTGGGFYNDSGSPVLRNITFEKNNASYCGGMNNIKGNPSLNKVVFTNNTSTSNTGGGMCNTGNPSLTDVTFINNIGDGMYNYNGQPVLINIVFQGNSSNEPGGGLNSQGENSHLSLSNVTFINNSSALEGGGMFDSSDGELTNVTFIGNSAGDYGGGLETAGNSTLINVTFVNNTAPYGGGVSNGYGGSLKLINVTLKNNSAQDDGGGVYNYQADLLSDDSILWGNTANHAGNQVFNESSKTSTLAYSVIEDGCPSGSTCSNLIITDPKLGELGNYGGFTQTIPLLSGSSAIDTGNDLTCASTDQRGVTRPQGIHCDIGAYELKKIPAPFAKISPSNGTTNKPASLTLKWGISNGATSYQYCYGTSNPCTNWQNNGTATSKVITGLSANTTYYWQVRAINKLGTTYANGSNTDWHFTTGKKPIAFSKTSPVNGATNQSGNVNLKWAASIGATRYEYCYSKTQSCSTWVSVGTSTGKALSGLSANTTYYWQIRAINTFGATYANGSATAFWSFNTGNKPLTFAKSNPINGATSQPTNLTLRWGTSAGATRYEYCYDTTNDNNCSNWINSGTATSANLSNLSTNTKYFWQVRAINSFGTTYANGSFATFWSFTTGISSSSNLDSSGNY